MRDTPLLDVDLADAATYANGTPHELFARLRRERPVYWNERNDGGPGIWCITKHAHIAAIGRDWQRFTSERGVNIKRFTPEEAQAMAALLIFTDPPRHTRLRSLVNLAFTPRQVAALDPLIRTNAHASLDRVIESGACNFFDVAADLPIRTICSLLGVPDRDHMRVLDWTNRTFGSEDEEYCPEPDDQVRAFAEMFTYTNEMVEQRRAQPTADIMSTLANATIDDEPITEQEMGNMFFILMGAGNDTTRGTLLNAMKVFAAHPEQWEAMRQDRSLIPNAVDEVLRFESSVRGMGRQANVDVEIGDTLVRAGDQVHLWYNSSSRDEALFDDPDRFDIRRQNAGRHQSFGGGGQHYCVGSALATSQLRIMFDVLLDRMPHFDVVGEPTYIRSVQFNALKVLPISFAPGPVVGSGS